MYQHAGTSQKDPSFAIAAKQKGTTENRAQELDDVVKMAVKKCNIDCYIYIRKPICRQILNQNQIPDHAARTYNMDTRDQKLSPQLKSLSAAEGKRYTEQRTHLTDSYFCSGKMKVESMNTCLNLKELRETIGVSPGNKKSADTIDGQTLSSKVEEPISCDNGGEPVTPSHQRD